MSKGRFVAVFLVAFALIAAVSTYADVPRFYGLALRGTASYVQPALTGWRLEHRPDQSHKLWMRHGEQRIKFLFSLEKWALGLYPLLSLIVATPGLSPRRRALAAAFGIAGIFLLDLVVILFYPYLIKEGALPQIVGQFLGMVTFVAAPVVLWFAFTYREMSGVWRLAIPATVKPRS